MYQPAINDNEYVLIFKVAHNLWEAAGSEASGIVEPEMGEQVQPLLKKAVSASALL